ncbi:hypothetical protein GCM10027575_06490 [Phytohabitans suffuscus]
MNSTSDTANENFITDHGSMRLTLSLARRGPREAADATVLRAARTASPTRAAPTAAAPVPAAAPTVRTDAPPAAARPVPGLAGMPGGITGAPGAGPGVTGAAPPGGELTGALPAAAIWVVAPGAAAGFWPSADGCSGGGGMPGARVNFGDGASAGTAARPTTARPVAGAPPGAASPSTGLVEVPAAPDFACVSVIN